MRLGPKLEQVVPMVAGRILLRGGGLVLFGLVKPKKLKNSK